MKHYKNIWKEVEVNKDIKEALEKEHGLSCVISSYLSSKFNDVKEIDEFFNQTIDLQKLSGLNISAERINKAVKNREKILIVGDYDVDGMSATALVLSFLREASADVKYLIPNRYEHGYGLSSKLVATIENTDLVITVDCGIKNVEEVRLLTEKGIDVIITDHHELGEELPEAVSLINPKLDDILNRDISGSFVAWYLCKYMSEKYSYNFSYHLDIFAMLGTITDVMPLIMDNRYIVSKGLETLNSGIHKGLCLLSKKLNISNVTARDIAFRIGPVINASGRMGKENLGMKLLLNENIEETINQILLVNDERKSLQEKMISEAKRNIDLSSNVIVAKGKWLKGITGIGAARLANDFSRPCILVDESDLTASARSFGNIDILDIVSRLNHHLDKFGGHRGAAGFTIKNGSYDDFVEELKIISNNISSELEKNIFEYVIGSVKELDLNFANEQLILEPTGNSFEKPLIRLDGVHINRVDIIGKNSNVQKIYANYASLKLEILSFSLIPITENTDYDMLVNIGINEFRGIKKISIILIDLRRSDGLYEGASFEYIELCKSFVTIVKKYDNIYNIDFIDEYVDKKYLSIEELPERKDLVEYYKKLIKEGEVVGIDKIENLFSFLLALEIFKELGLLEYSIANRKIYFKINKNDKKVDLNKSKTYINILKIKEDYYGSKKAN